MKVHVEHMLKLAGNEAGGMFRHTLPALAADLKKLKLAHLRGEQAALDDFFKTYVFGFEEYDAKAHANAYPGF